MLEATKGEENILLFGGRCAMFNGNGCYPGPMVCLFQIRG